MRIRIRNPGKYTNSLPRFWDFLWYQFFESSFPILMLIRIPNVVLTKLIIFSASQILPDSHYYHIYCIWNLSSNPLTSIKKQQFVCWFTTIRIRIRQNYAFKFILLKIYLKHWPLLRYSVRICWRTLFCCRDPRLEARTRGCTSTSRQELNPEPTHQKNWTRPWNRPSRPLDDSSLDNFPFPPRSFSCFLFQMNMLYQWPVTACGI